MNKPSPYLLAADWILRGTERFSCNAIDEAVASESFGHTPERKAYISLFSTEPELKCGYIIYEDYDDNPHNHWGHFRTEQEQRNFRALLLCFADAIISAGDAP